MTVEANLTLAPTKSFGRTVVIPLMGVVLFALALVIAFVLATAARQDDEALRASARLAETALSTKEQDVSRNLKDYAFWQDAFDNLHTKVNLDWAATDGNVGANIYNSLGYDMAFVLSPAKQTVYALVEGKPVSLDALHVLPQIGLLLPDAAKGGAAAVGFMRSGSDVVIAGASAILPSNPADAPPVEARSIMIFVKRVDAKFLEQMSHNYLLKDLGFSDRDGAGSQAALPLRQADGTVLGNLVWTPDRPGQAVLRTVLPTLAVVAATLLIFAQMVLRNAGRSAKALQTSAQTIKDYATTLENSEARFRDVAEATSDWIWEVGPDLAFTFASQRMGSVTGLSEAEILGKQFTAFFASDSASEGWSQVQVQVARREAFRDLRCCYRDMKGSNRICRVAGRPVLGLVGTFLGYRGTATDVTDEVAAQERANHLALHDPLTGLPNRVLLKDRLTVALEGVQRDKGRVAVLCLDLDHFKEINDTMGHATGDRLLQQLAERLQSRIRGMDTVARLGGDEFAIIQVGLDQPADAETLSRRLLEDVAQPFTIDGTDLYVGVSIGIAIAPDDGATEAALLKHADLALYRSKQAGRSTFRFFETSMDSELQARKAMEQDLRRALARNELQVFYQPLVAIAGDVLTGVEALLRWPHPIRGMIPPVDFIPLAEETGLIVQVGEWVLRTACRQAVAWPGAVMAVNVSAIQFKHRDFVDLVRQVLEETGLEPRRLELEITEGVLLHDTAGALDVLTALKALGVRIAMDDFGTGYSSLGYLNSFPFDKIKIDRSFITDVGSKETSSAIVRSVITLGQSLRMVTTAEGVETLDQLEFLRSEGCQQVQGYYFGRPVPSDELPDILRRRGVAGLLRALPAASLPAAVETIAQIRALPAPPVKRRAREDAETRRRDLRAAAGFARRRGKPLTYAMVFRPTHLADRPDEVAAWWTDLQARMAAWMNRQAAAGGTAGWYAVWAREGRGPGLPEHCHLLLHCPSEALALRLSRAFANRLGGGDLLSSEAVEWAARPRRRQAPASNFMAAQADLVPPGTGRAGPAAGPRVAGPVRGVSPSLRKDARAEWRAADAAVSVDLVAAA